MRKDPVEVFRFKVEIDGLEVGGFSEVSGLEAEIETHEYVEGGLNQYRHVFPKGIKYPRLILKRGITNDNTLLKWYNQCASGNIFRRSGAVILFDYEHQEVRRWKFVGAYPVKCSYPQLKALGSEVAIEAFELVHRGLTMYPA